MAEKFNLQWQYKREVEIMRNVLSRMVIYSCALVCLLCFSAVQAFAWKSGTESDHTLTPNNTHGLMSLNSLKLLNKFAPDHAKYYLQKNGRINLDPEDGVIYGSWKEDYTSTDSDEFYKAPKVTALKWILERFPDFGQPGRWSDFLIKYVGCLNHFGTYASSKAGKLIKKAVFDRNSDSNESWKYVGRSLHLMQDMTMPMHTDKFKLGADSCGILCNDVDSNWQRIIYYPHHSDYKGCHAYSESVVSGKLLSNVVYG